MVQIGLSDDGQSIEIRIRIWFLAQVIDSDNWVQEIVKRCQELVIERINEMKPP